MRPATDDDTNSILQALISASRSHLYGAFTGYDMAWCLSNAGESLHNATRHARKGRLSPKQHAEIRAYLEGARVVAMRRLPAFYSREKIADGFGAYAKLVDVWASVGSGHEMRGAARMDVDARARIFQNHMHNMVLFDDIAHRARGRRQATIDCLMHTVPA